MFTLAITIISGLDMETFTNKNYNRNYIADLHKYCEQTLGMTNEAQLLKYVTRINPTHSSLGISLGPNEINSWPYHGISEFK